MEEDMRWIKERRNRRGKGSMIESGDCYNRRRGRGEGGGVCGWIEMCKCKRLVESRRETGDLRRKRECVERDERRECGI